MNKTIPGKILIIDDQFDDIKPLMWSFMERGEACIYRDSIKETDETIKGARLVILDLDVDGDGQVTDGDIGQIALFLSRLVTNQAAFYLVAIYSIQIKAGERGDEFIERIKASYEITTGEELNAFFLDPIGKNEVKREIVIEKIQEWVSNNPMIGMLFEIDSMIEREKDKTFRELIDLEGGSVKALINQIMSDARGAPAIEVVSLFGRVLTQKLASGDLAHLRTLIDRISNAKGGDVNPEWYAAFSSFQSYNNIDPEGQIWTGDIIDLGGLDEPGTLAIVLTPKCDFQQNRTETVQVARGYKVDNTQEAQNSACQEIKGKPAYGKDNKLTREGNEFLSQMIAGKGLPSQYYVLRYLKQSTGFSHFVIDLRNIRGENLLKEQEAWKAHRLARLDSPFMEDLQQKNAAFISRVGLPDIPDAIKNAELDRLNVSTKT